MKIYLHEPTVLKWKEECFPENKITFIKRVRTFYATHNGSLGLREAKAVMEHYWQEWSKP